ncbi:MAG: hypothetical protein MUO58_21580 [Anaerolineales bacterium]|nr:hypothetical protein [Anaerolineales bacterium]
MIQTLRTRISRINWMFFGYSAEVVAVVFGAGMLARFGFIHGGQVFASDTLMYIDTGLHGIANPFVLNRYTHIFILRFFTYFASTPLDGIRAYSGFVAFSCTLLVYYSARIFSKKSSSINGIIAVGLFLGVPVILERIIAPLVDTTAMLMMLSLAAIYIKSARKNHSNRWLLVLFGVLFFISLRTKEVTIVAAILILGCGLTLDEPINSRMFIKNSLYIAVGMVIAALLNVAINAIVLDTPFFGFRPADISAYIESWSVVIGSSGARAGGVTFDSLLMAKTGFLFVLYVSAGLILRRRLPRNIRLLWIIPLALVAILILFSTRDQWVIVSRGFTPGFAIICILGSQVVLIDGLRRASLGSDAAAVLVTLIGIGVLSGIGLATKGNLPFEVYFYAAYGPIAFSLILTLLFLSHERRKSGIAIALLLLSINVYQIRLNLLEVASKPEVLRYNYRFQPILAFEEQIRDQDGLEMYVSSAVLHSLAIGGNRDELSALVNIALDIRTERADYVIGTPDNEFVGKLEVSKYSHIMITTSDWDWLRTAPQDRPEWRSRYTASTEPSNRSILLQRVEISPSPGE